MWSEGILSLQRHLDRTCIDAQVSVSCLCRFLWGDASITVHQPPVYCHLTWVYGLWMLFLAVQTDIMHGNKSGPYAQYLSLAFSWFWLLWATWVQEMCCRVMLSLSLPQNLFLILVCSFWVLWGVRFAMIVSLCDLKSRSRVCLVAVVLFAQIHHLVCHLLRHTEISAALGTHSIYLFFYIRVWHFVYWVRCIGVPPTLLKQCYRRGSVLHVL